MGTCFSKKGPSTSHSSSKVSISATTPDPSKHILNPKPNAVEVRIKKPTEVEIEEARAEKGEEESSVKKEMLVTKHRKSHDRAVIGSIVSSHESAVPEEVGKDVITSTVSSSSHTAAIRTSSCTKEEVDAILIQCGRLSHNTPSKAASGSRKYSGSKRSFDFDSDPIGAADDYCEDKEGSAEEHRHRERNRQSRASPQGRRRRTPSREREEQSQRSNSKERGSGSRRVSRSPGKRSGSSSTATNARPGKMVSVPASLAVDKSNNGCGEPAVAATSAVKRINVKRNGGVASPRAQSPARGCNENVRARSPARGSNENARARSPARTNARKAEQSPYRRNPLSEIDPNSLAYVNNSNRVHIKNKEFEADGQRLTVGQGANHKTIKIVDCPSKEQAQITRSVTVTAVPPTLTRSRSSRKSQDLDMNLNQEANLNANPSYTSLLLEDIQNFHQKSTLHPTSIGESVADLNSGTFSEHSLPQATTLAGKKRAEHKEAFVESEVIVEDDLMEPSLHKYVTVRRGGSRGTQLEEEESSGSNSIVGGVGQHCGVSSSSWEPNSADSTDRWTSRSNTKDIDHQQSGIGHGKVGGMRGPQAVVVAASS